MVARTVINRFLSWIFLSDTRIGVWALEPEACREEKLEIELPELLDRRQTMVKCVSLCYVGYIRRLYVSVGLALREKLWTYQNARATTLFLIEGDLIWFTRNKHNKKGQTMPDTLSYALMSAQYSLTIS